MNMNFQLETVNGRYLFECQVISFMNLVTTQELSVNSF